MKRAKQGDMIKVNDNLDCCDTDKLHEVRLSVTGHQYIECDEGYHYLFGGYGEQLVDFDVVTPK